MSSIIEIIDGEEWLVTTLPSGGIERRINRPVVTPPEPQTKMSRLDFYSRFTFDELVAVEAAAVTNPAVRVLQNQINTAEFIDINDQRTILGVMYLNSVGLLTVDRANEILTPDIEA